MTHHNPLNEICIEHIYSTFELLGQFNNLEANSRALMLKNDAFSQTSSIYSAYLLRIVNMDSLYTSLQFSKPGFFRKNLLDQYLRLYNDLKKDEQILSMGKNGHIYKIFLEYAKIRFELINIYGELSKANCNTYSAILDHVKVLEWDNSQSMNFPSLSIGIIKEISIIKNLLLAQLSLISYNFKNSVLYTYLAKNDLNQWINNLQTQIKHQQETQTLETGKAELEIPNNQKWLKKFLSYTLAKINVYFNIILSKKSSEILHQINLKTDPDPLNMIKNFVSKNNNILNISFIYSSLSKNTSIRPDGGYSCISTVPLTGIHSYPAIFSFPNEPPLNHWPNIISIIQSKQKHHQYLQTDSFNKDSSSKYSRKTLEYYSASISSLSNAASYLMGTRRYNEKRKRMVKSLSNSKDNSGTDKDISQSLDETSTVPFFFYDWKISISYYMIKVDPDVIIVLIYECQNKDPTIIDFLTKLVACLRNVTLFEQLKVDW
ncbi:hypothetical protein BCR32DRAFT_244177 [Anaeromyces robustus]|uniref:Uncharacterized protein n=1 Tax=Anaeromyces robustus TaxID=1754192 RepID=A0A1Y1XAG8_9FUNG|nr:hypothetical protein BCR32DRAFT_244177 [Anaeromyces robustus]|eukprot:ORX82436.1 hypothetical protein BCR32DRAFT_244177 [Anaeromyces robustus]